MIITSAEFLNFCGTLLFIMENIICIGDRSPAVLGVIVSSITSKPVTDTGLVFFFVIGIALFSVLLLRDIYKEYKLPAWVFWGGVFAATVNIPLIWMLTRPKFYEVSISGGQFFLMAGFFAMFRAFRSQCAA